MGFNFRKSIKIGPARVNLSKSGVGYSVGAKGFRYTKSPKKKKQNGLWEFFKGLFFLALLVTLICFIIEYKTVFIILGVLAAIALIAYLVYVHKQLHPTSQELSAASDDMEGDI